MKKAVSICLLMTLVSCGIGGKQGPLNFSVNEDEPIRAEEVNFAVLQKEVLPKCISCHKDWTSEQVVNRFTRENLPEQSRLFTTVRDGKMPKRSPPLSSELLEIVRNYVQNIRYIRPEEIPIPDDGRPVSFETVNEKVFKVSCLPCHSQKALKDEASLSASPWINRQTLEESKLLTSVTSGKMPKERNLLSPNQVDLIRRYLRNFR